MIFDYGFSIIGKSHIVTNTCCQDSHRIMKMDSGWNIAAIADGVGSAKNSQIGSKIAVDTAVAFCYEFMPWDYNIISIKSMIRTAYNYAFKQILRESEKSGEPIESYDTTLSLVIYDGRRVIYGHSGDGAIIGLTIFGDFVEITKPQKGLDYVSVIPLRSGYTKWVIDAYEEDLVSVLLMTDGMLETLCPYLLRENGVNKVYIPLGAYFADPHGIGVNDNETREQIKEFIIASDTYNSKTFYTRLARIYKKHIPNECDAIISDLAKLNYSNILMQKEEDDKTIVGLINTGCDLDDKTPEYFSEPDWEKLQDAWNRKAYPHLYRSETQNEVPKIISYDSEKTTVTETKTANLDLQVMLAQNNSTSMDSKDDMADIFKSPQISASSDKIESPSLNNVDKPSLITSDIKGADAYEGSSERTVEEIPPAQRHECPKKKNFLDRIRDMFN